jgi:DNA ligase-1
MKAFVELYHLLDSSPGIKAKVDLLASFFENHPNSDGLWALALLSGQIGGRRLNSAALKQLSMREAGLPEWLFAECYSVAGDLAETMTHLFPEPGVNAPNGSLSEWMQAIEAQRGLPPEQQQAFVLETWKRMPRSTRFVFNKLITGGFRVGVSKGLLVQALAKATEQDAEQIQYRLTGQWHPKDTQWQALLLDNNSLADISKPYPFFLAHAYNPETPEPKPTDWQVEWKWDGIRCQWVCRQGHSFLWSRGEELITDAFPELTDGALPMQGDWVLDGELLPGKPGDWKPFSELQRRLNRKRLSSAILKEIPVGFMAYDLLEWQGKDIRTWPLRDRRALLENEVQNLPRIGVSPAWVGDVDLWVKKREDAAQQGAEGVMLKHLDSTYGVGRKRGSWWKWKVEPRSFDAVLTYAQRGHGNRANLYTDFTFGVWWNGELLTVAKAYSGLTTAELTELSRFVSKHSLDSFGPVRRVEPLLVFEIGFDGIQESKRHKSGIALRFPRIFRWRRDKKPEQADTLDVLRAMIEDARAPD